MSAAVMLPMRAVPNALPKLFLRLSVLPCWFAASVLCKSFRYLGRALSCLRAASKSAITSFTVFVGVLSGCRRA